MIKTNINVKHISGTAVSMVSLKKRYFFCGSFMLQCISVLCLLCFRASLFIDVLYNPFLVYCRELAPGPVSLTGDRAQGDDNKHESHYSHLLGKG